MGRNPLTPQLGPPVPALAWQADVAHSPSLFWTARDSGKSSGIRQLVVETVLFFKSTFRGGNLIYLDLDYLLYEMRITICHKWADVQVLSTRRKQSYTRFLQHNDFQPVCPTNFFKHATQDYLIRVTDVFLLRWSVLKNANIQHNNSHLVLMNQSYPSPPTLFFGKMGKNTLLVCRIISVISLCVTKWKILKITALNRLNVPIHPFPPGSLSSPRRDVLAVRRAEEFRKLY